MEANALFGCVKEKSQTKSLSAQSINIITDHSGVNLLKFKTNKSWISYPGDSFKNIKAFRYLYSTDLDKIPKRFLTGLPAQHLFQEISSGSHNATLRHLYRLEANQIRNFFIIANKENVKTILETVHCSTINVSESCWVHTWVLQKYINQKTHRIPLLQIFI